MNDTPKVIRDTDADAIRLGKTLLRNARYGALGVLNPDDGAPSVTRVGVATDLAGNPLILVSQLTTHTKAIQADPRCSLLLGETGKGDPLAHPRITIACHAEKIDPGTDEAAHIKWRYLSRNPKAQLYVGLGDFSFYRLNISSAGLNGGFGKAYRFTASDLKSATLDGFDRSEQGAVEHMNADHADAIQLYATHFARQDAAQWRISGLDADGIDLISGDRSGRAFYPSPLTEASQLRMALVDMAKVARAQQG